MLRNSGLAEFCLGEAVRRRGRLTYRFYAERENAMEIGSRSSTGSRLVQ
jgi:hypothetical protein